MPRVQSSWDKLDDRSRKRQHQRGMDYPPMLRIAVTAFVCCILFCAQNATAQEQHPHRHQHQHRKREATRIERIDRHFSRFVTRPDIDAPSWRLAVYDGEALAPGYWFVAPYQQLEQGTPGDAWVGPHIYDGRGELVWSGSGVFQHWNTFDFGMTTIDGQQMMTILFPHGKLGVILDENYRIWKQVALDGIRADMHAFRIIENGKRALVVTNQRIETSVEEAKVIGVNGTCSVAFVGFAELNVDEPTPPLFVWDAYRHIGLEEGTYNTNVLEDECSHSWDMMHANAIDKFPDGSYLMSSRHTDALYKISHVDGSIVRRLGGVKSDFQFLGPGNPMFSRQHHAVVHSQKDNEIIISLFDNAIGSGDHEHETNAEARGLLLSLDTVEMTVGIVAEYRHPKGHTVSSRGSFQLLPNGNALLCWTYSSHISEHTPNGTLIMEAILPIPAHSYRAFKYPWIGRPTMPPDVVAEAISTKHNDTHTMVYVSWNGATEVATWVVYNVQPDGEEEQTAVVSVPREGFETAIICEETVDFVVVEARDKRGGTLGRSKVVRTVPLEEQGLNLLSYVIAEEMRREDTVVSLVVSLVPDSLIAFVLGFLTCTLFAAVLVGSCKRIPLSWRRLCVRGPRYELLAQETPLSSPCSKRVE